MRAAGGAALRAAYADGTLTGTEGLDTAVPWDERLARVALTRVADPGDEVMGRAVRDRGAARRAPGRPRRKDAARRRAAQDRQLPAPGRPGRPGGRPGRRAPRRGPLPVPGGRRLARASSTTSGRQRPYGLWVRGRPSLRLWALRSVAVVGARACTDYGAHMAARLGAGLADAGLGRGVRSRLRRRRRRARAAPSQAGGATVGVVASGVDVPYPRGQRRTDRPDRRTRPADRGAATGRPPHPEQVRAPQPGHRRAHPGHRRGRGPLPQRLADHRAPGRRARPGHHGRARALHQRPVGGRARTAARRAPPWSPTPPKSSNWSARSAPTSPRSGTARCCRATGCAPPPPGSWRRCPARARPPSEDIARRGRHQRRRHARAGCTNCRRSASSNVTSGRWTLVRTARGESAEPDRLTRATHHQVTADRRDLGRSQDRPGTAPGARIIGRRSPPSAAGRGTAPPRPPAPVEERICACPTRMP